MAWQTNSKRHAELPPNWDNIRRVVLAAAGYKCAQCGGKATHVDHMGDPLNHNTGNLQALCASCHNKKTGGQGGRSYRKGGRRQAPKRLPEPHPAYK